jgi:hypothetical protein
MNEAHYGYVVNCHYDAVNMLTRMKVKNPKRYKEFQYDETHIYNLLDELQHQQNLQD